VGAPENASNTIERSAMSESNAAPQISGKMFLYEKPELLNFEQHGDLGIAPNPAPFKFAVRTRALPLTVSEIASATRDYPVVFMSVEDPVPMAVVGLVEDVNLYIGENGRWEEHVYVPAYVRRYPFGVALENGSDRFAVVVDRASESLVPGGQQKIFEGEGLSKFAQDAVDFTQKYEEDRRVTQQFSQTLKSYDLLSVQTGQYAVKDSNNPQNFATYVGVDENKLKNLPDDKFLELRNNGILPLLYAQMMSMGNWRAVIQRRAERYNLTEDSLLKPIQTS
jgi:hypothetical protein